jgi:hypothetical protein
MAALPIKVSTTRRERFMMYPSRIRQDLDQASVADAGLIAQGERGGFTASCGPRLDATAMIAVPK